MDLTFYCAIFKMGISFAPDRLNLLARRSIHSSRRPGTALRRACASTPLNFPKTAPWLTRIVPRVLANTGLATSCISKRENASLTLFTLACLFQLQSGHCSACTGADSGEHRPAVAGSA